MEVTTSSLEDGRVQIHVSVSPEEYRQAITDGIRTHLQMEGVKIPPNTTPEDLLSQAIGKDEDKPAAELEFAVDYLMPRAVDKAHIMPVATPTVDRPNPPEPGQGIEFDVFAYPKPEMDLSSYGPVFVTVHKPQVTEEEIDGQIKVLLRVYATHTTSGTSGLRKGELPKLTDAWVAESIQDPNCNTVADLRNKIRESGLKYKQRKMHEYETGMAVAELSKRLVGDVPERIVDVMAHSMRSELDERLKEQGLTENGFAMQQHLNHDQLMDRIREQAREMLREGFTLDAVYRHEKLSIDKDDIADAIHQIAPGNEESTEAALNGSGYLSTVRETAQRTKAGRWVRRHAHIKVK